jgi:hypothetical protein
MFELISATDLARLAAFVDGEGSIVLGSRPRPLRDLRLQLCNTDPRLVLWAKDLFGGSVTSEARSDVVANTRNVFRWHVTGRRAELLLKAIFPYLILKKEQAEVAIAYRLTIGSAGKRLSDEVRAKRKALTERLTELKHINYDVKSYAQINNLPALQPLGH